MEKGSMKKIFVHGGIKYKCEQCSARWFIYVEVGVEDGGRPGQHECTAKTTGLKCSCGSRVLRISELISFPAPKLLRMSAPYFAYNPNGTVSKLSIYHAPTVVRDTPKVRRNDLCPCGSGKKFKRCCKETNHVE